MTKPKAINKTELFQALERELRASGNSASGIQAQLDEATADLKPWFENPSMLVQALNVGGLTYEHAFLRGKKADSSVNDIVKTLLSEFREARDRNPHQFISFWAEYMQSTDRAIKNTAAVAVLQGNKEHLEPALLVKSWFRDVGDFLEGSLQPFARLRLEVWGWLGRRAPTAQPVEVMSFGSVVSELLAVSQIGDIYRPPPFDLSISQWRNIANHNSYEVSGDQVTCTYGMPGKQKTLSLSIHELAGVFGYCNDLGYAHKVAIEFFGIDNTTEILKHSPSVTVSDYTKVSSFVYGLVSAGFSIVHAGYLPGKWLLILVDQQERRERDVKTALQEASYPYVLIETSIEISAKIRSKSHTYQIGFVASTASKSDALPNDFRGDIWEIEDGFRLGRHKPQL